MLFTINKRIANKVKPTVYYMYISDNMIRFVFLVSTLNIKHAKNIKYNLDVYYIRTNLDTKIYFKHFIPNSKSRSILQLDYYLIKGRKFSGPAIPIYFVPSSCKCCSHFQVSSSLLQYLPKTILLIIEPMLCRMRGNGSIGIPKPTSSIL